MPERRYSFGIDLILESVMPEFEIKVEVDRENQKAPYRLVDGHLRIAAMDRQYPDKNYTVESNHGTLHRKWISSIADFEIKQTGSGPRYVQPLQPSEYSLLADAILRSKHPGTERAKNFDNIFRFVMPQEYDFNEVRILGTLEWLRRNGPAPMYIYFVEQIKTFGYGHLL